MRGFENIFWLGIKEMRSLFASLLLVLFIVYAFTVIVYQQATGVPETIFNASVAVVDEDQSNLSGRLRDAIYPPYFQTPQLIESSEINRVLDDGEYLFVVVIPPRFEADIKAGRHPEIQLNIDATAARQSSLGATYLQTILSTEISQFAARSDEPSRSFVKLQTHLAFNPNGTQSWFTSIVAVLDQLTMFAIILTGAALIREREHGTIEHLLVMPLKPVEIVLSKVWANAIFIVAVFTFSMLFIVEGAIGVPMAGSRLLLLGGTGVYLLATSAIGIFLGTISRSMAQFALLVLITIIPMMMLSGGTTPIESQPELLQPITWFLPSRHYISFATGVIYRGAGLDVLWPELLTIAGLGSAFFVASILQFRSSISVSK